MQRRIDEARTYDGEKVAWTPCGELDGERLESSTIHVPMDQINKTTDDANQTFSIPLLRLRGANATKNLLVNPGGPGTSGTSLILRRGKRLRAIVGDGYHILGFDPRGVNKSHPAAVFYSDQGTRDRLAPSAPSQWAIPISDAGRLKPRISAWADNISRASAETNGEHGKYLNTPQTAADMSSILDAVGQQDMHYWGFSYGSLLGQTYAMMFPERSARIIIDGVVDVFEWYGELLRRSEFESRPDTFRGFFDECIKAKDDCALSSFASNAEELQCEVMGFLDKLDQDPVSVYVDNTTHGVLDKHTLYQAMLRELFFHENWQPLADRLAKLMQGDGKPAFLAYGQQGRSAPLSSEHNSIIRFNDMISGKDNWPQGQDLFNYILPLLEMSPNDAVEILQEYYTKAQWAIPKTHEFTPPRHVETKHPLLILSMTCDPFTPLSSAHKASQAFRGSRVVEVEGYGHSSLSVRSDGAVEHVRRFLHDGVLPEQDVKCAVDSLYFPKRAV
ncbi:DUF1740-domain-containing protein [Purpureocillium lavendulum]|uniref:DUF1740-domain-containing protein n=1 Tax=Purpureocillium lavendulum TaxID=1247861 RepID=A0AB34G4K3_9HYPO|nr:DUF1740-domain-containing protein [Purpureocillium lavendulum]